MSAALVEVTQAARDAAAAIYDTVDGPDSHRATNARLGNMDDLPIVQLCAHAINEAELRGARLMQEAAVSSLGIANGMPTHSYEPGFRDIETIRTLDPATIIARAALTETDR